VSENALGANTAVGVNIFLPCRKKVVFLQSDKDYNVDEQSTKKICDYFATQPVLKAWVFGSYARGDQREDSDIDLLVQFDRENAKVGLFKYAAMIIDLENLLHREVDLVEDGSLLPFAERTANKDKKLIYERIRA
jgi:hypothetical protein